MSIVPQEVFLLEGSLLANLFPFTNLEHVHLPLFQYIAQMAIECIGIGHLNLEREVSNVSLSSGERHLVSIARVICLSLNLATEHDSKGRLTFVGNLLPVEMVDGGFNAVDGGRLEIKDLPRVSLRNETLIIDEPVAFLGAVAEGKMWTGLLSCFPDATVICVTHKLATLFKYFERIVVLEKGVVVATGSPAELKMRGILSK
jgi:ABC-type multidrug transport system fused ATPase/permease subunit